MVPPYTELGTCVQPRAPTGRQPRHESFARLIGALLERPPPWMRRFAARGLLSGGRRRLTHSGGSQEYRGG